MCHIRVSRLFSVLLVVLGLALGGLPAAAPASAAALPSGLARSSASMPVVATRTATAIAAGGGFTCALSAAGGVWCWGGFDLSDPLGGGARRNHAAPVVVRGLSTGVKAIAAGNQFTCALTEAGGVWCWGDNYYGELGDGTLVNSPTPVAVSGLPGGVKALAAGGRHACALTEAGDVWCWGYNNYGQFGNGTTGRSVTAVAVSGLTNVKAIAAGVDHTCVLTTAGGVLCAGNNQHGQLGDGTVSYQRTTYAAVSGLSSGVQAIAAGYYYTCALTEAGGALCWGANANGQLGDGTTTDSPTPVVVSGLSSGASAIDTGSSQTCAVTEVGGVRCWGYNYFGQLGDGTTTDSPTPVAVNGLPGDVTSIAAGGEHTCALTEAGDVWCWGANGGGEAGYGVVTSQSTPVAASGLTALAVRGGHGCALTEAGAVLCWGNNLFGQVGDGTTHQQSAPVPVSGLTGGMQAVATGMSHMCAVTEAGGVSCWGYNNYGQLGNGTTNNSSTPVAVSGLTSGVRALAAGNWHTCALTTEGGVLCWGFYQDGQSGGTPSGSTTPVAVSGLTSGVKAIAAMGTRTCALTDAGGLTCWAGFFPTPAAVSGLPADVTGVAVGSAHTCVVTAAGTALCWGDNEYGELGDGTTTYRSTPVVVSGLASGVKAIAAGFNNTCALMEEGGVKCWGENGYAQAGNGTRSADGVLSPVTAAGITAGATAVAVSDTVCALFPSGDARCWGNNFEGARGDGEDWRPTPTRVLLLANQSYLPSLGS